MIRVKVSCGRPEVSELFIRQTHGRLGIWGDCQFLVNEPVENCDWWVVCHGSGLSKAESAYCDPKHLVYISMEPSENIGCIAEGFLNQFSHLVLCDRKISHPNIKYANGITWWVGMSVLHEDGSHQFSSSPTLDYDSLNEMVWPKRKNNRISIIISDKRFIVGHASRLDFLKRLLKYPIGDHIDVYGGGFNSIPDKWDAIAPYRYHLVLENSSKKDYWSEKLADAYLGFAFPIYHGCTNISDYFPVESYLSIDIGDVSKSAATLMELINGNSYENHQDAIAVARKRVLNDFNIFQMMTDICNCSAQQSVKCWLKPNTHFVSYWKNQLIRKMLLRVGALSAS